MSSSYAACIAAVWCAKNILKIHTDRTSLQSSCTMINICIYRQSSHTSSLYLASAWFKLFVANLSISCSIVSQKPSIRYVPVAASLSPCGMSAVTANRIQCLVRSVMSCSSEYSTESSSESVRERGNCHWARLQYYIWRCRMRRWSLVWLTLLHGRIRHLVIPFSNHIYKLC